jgi:hypothetical protein
VTYREVDMLIDKKTASSRQLQRVAEVVIHELAHQWFGNLVTMEWWEDLWLNEGFATWMETGVRSRRPVVWRRLHAIDATHVRQTRSWVVSFSSLRPFGPRRETAMLRAGDPRTLPGLVHVGAVYYRYAR